MTPRVAVVDYGAGNIHSVCHALGECNADIKLTQVAADLATATHIVLPGVGAMRPALERLRSTGLDQAIAERVRAGTPTLGICLGMQLLATSGQEGGNLDALGLIDGSVERLCPIPREGHKVPRLGWYPIERIDSAQPRGAWNLFSGMVLPESFYFAHSFHLKVRSVGLVSAVTPVSDGLAVAAIQKGSLFGTQFHPEKSGAIGLRVLLNFLAEGAE